MVPRRWPGEDWAEGLVRREASALTGQPDLSPADMQSWLSQLATTQAAIHAVPDHPQTRWMVGMTMTHHWTGWPKLA